MTREENTGQDQTWQDEYSKIMNDILMHELELKAEFKVKLKGLINITGLFRDLDETTDSWMPVDIVEVELTDEKLRGYPTYDCGRIKGEKGYLYMKQKVTDIRGIYHVFGWQRTEYEDCYSGWQLYPLKNGLYFKISYSC